MFLSISEALTKMGSVPSIIISLAMMMFLGFLMTRLTKLVKLPNVTAYILAGILIGPFCLDLIPHSEELDIISKTDFLSDIALAFIAFSTGEFFKIDVLKKNGVKAIIITIFEAMFASILVFILTFVILKLDLAFSLVLASLASATAPASTMMTIRQTNAKGDFVETLLQVVALDDIVALLFFSIAISVAEASESTLEVMSIIKPILYNILVLALGGVFGFVMKLLMPKSRSTDNRLIIALAILFAFCGICALIDVSPLLGCMSMGMIYINVSGDEKLFSQLGYFSPPILLLFFVRSGMTFDLKALVDTSSVNSKVPLIVIGVLYFLIRIIGKYSGAYLGSAVAKKKKEVRNYLGLALVPQAGVAIGLAALGARCLGGESGNMLNTIILASSVLYELVGPGLAKLSLYLSKSYSNNIEDISNVDIINEKGEKKTEVELLIDRIKEIQETIPHEDVSPEEAAFTEAAMEYQNSYRQRNVKWRRR